MKNNLSRLLSSMISIRGRLIKMEMGSSDRLAILEGFCAKLFSKPRIPFSIDESVSRFDPSDVFSRLSTQYAAASHNAQK